MKFLVDAQLPRRLVHRLRAAGHDAIHTLDLPDRNLTPDDQVCGFADAQARAVITKDMDFVDSFFIRGRPEKLLLVSVGNITNDALWKIMSQQLSGICTAFEQHAFIELTTTAFFVRK